MICYLRATNDLGQGFVRFYNTEWRHRAVGYVPPDQKHGATDKDILARRGTKKLLTRRRRFDRNRHLEVQVFTMAKAGEKWCFEVMIPLDNLETMHYR